MKKAIDFISAVARKILSMRGKGIASIANRSDAEAKAGEIAAIFQQSGLPMNRLDEFIKSEKDVTKYLNLIEESAKSKVKQSIQPKPLMKSSKPGDVIDFPPERITDWTKARPQPPEIEMIDGIQTTRGMGDLFSKQMKNIGKKDPALYEDRGGNIIPAQFEIHPTSEIAKSLRLEAEAAKKLKNMSEAEIKLRGNRPYDTDEQIIARIEKQNKEAAERLRNKKNKDPEDPEKFAAGGVAGLLGERMGYAVGNQVMPAVDPRMQNTYETNTKLNQIQRNMQDRVRKGSKTQGLEIGQLTEGMYGKPKTEYNLNNPNLKFNEAQSYGAASNMGLRPEQIKAVAYYNTLRNNFGDEGMMAPQIAPPMFNQGQAVSTPMGGGLAGLTGVAPGTSPFAAEKFFKTPAEQFAQYQEGLRRSMMLNPNSGIYFDPKATYDAGDYISPEGIYTFSEPNPNASRGMMVEVQDVQDTINLFYQGGQAQIEPDLSDIGHGSDALMARNMLIAPGSQATTSTGLNYLLGEDNDTTRVPYKEKGSVTLADLIKVNASGSKSGKNQIMGAPDGITADTETFNAIIKMDIPIMEKINLLGSYGYGKDRFKVEKGNKELFLGEDGYKDRNIGLGFNQDGEGLSGSVIRNLETGDNDYQLKLLKSFAEGGRIGYNEGNMVLPKPKAMDEYLLKQVMSQAGANTLDVRTREMFIEQLKKKIRDKRATEEKKYQFEELRDQGAEDMYYNNREKELDIKYNPQNYPPSMRKFAGGGVAGLLGESPGSTDHGPRTMYAEGQLVQNTVDGSRPGYSGKKAQLVQEVIQLIKNLNKTAKLKGLEEKLIKKYKSEGVGFIEAIKKAQTEAGGVRYEGRMKIIDDAMKEANVHSDDYVDLLDMKIKIEDPDFAKQYVNFPENLKNKTRSRHDPDWAEANFGKEYGTKLDQARSREINQSIDPNFKEPLSQSDQMVSNIDDMNIANTDEFFGRKKNAEGGRIGYEEAGVVDKIGGMVNYKNVPYYVNSAAKGATDMAEWVSRLPFATTKLASDIIRKPLFKPGDRVPGLPGVGAKFVGGEMFNEFINNMTTGSWVDKLGLSSLVEEGGKKVSPEARTVGDIAESLGEFANVGGIFAAGKNLFKGGDSLKKLSQSMGKVKDNKTLEKLVDETLTARGEGRRDFNKLVASGGLMVALQSIGLGGIKAAKTKAAPDAVLTLKTIIDDSDVMTENGLQAIGREGSLIDVSGLTDAVKKSLAVIMKNRKNTFGNKVVRNKVKGKDGKFTEDYEDIPTEEAAYIMEELQKRGHNVKLEHYDDMGGQGVDDLLNKFKNKDKTYGKDNYDKFSKKVAKMTDKEKFAYHSSITDDSGNYYDEFVEELLDMNFKNSTK
jgi:hypothetical protein